MHSRILSQRDLAATAAIVAAAGGIACLLEIPKEKVEALTVTGRDADVVGMQQREAVADLLKEVKTTLESRDQQYTAQREESERVIADLHAGLDTAGKDREKLESQINDLTKERDALKAQVKELSKPKAETKDEEVKPADKAAAAK